MVTVLILKVHQLRMAVNLREARRRRRKGRNKMQRRYKRSHSVFQPEC
jgi:hypothetical protein